MSTKDRFYNSENELISQGKRLLNKTLFELYGDLSKKKYGGGKGGFGNKLEELHYGIINNNESRPDVENLGIEIKANPLIIVDKGKRISPDQRVTLSMINFTDIVSEDFESSHFWKKNKAILFNMFLLGPQEDYDRRFVIIDIIKPDKDDLLIIKKDWEHIKEKAKLLQADNLSQSDTMYLCAATKGVRNQKPMPYLDGKAFAKKRSYSYKHSYIAFYLSQYTLFEKDGKHYFEKKKQDTIRLLENEIGTTVEEKVIQCFSQFIGLSDYNISKTFGYEKMFENPIDKSRWHWNTSLILTGKKKKYLSKYIEEFSKSGLTVKTVRLNQNNNLCEEVSFRTQGYGNLIEDEWEDSSLYNEMSSKFLWIVYKEDSLLKGQFNLNKTIFWTMPKNDLDFLEKKWRELKNLIEGGDFRHEYFQEDISFYFLKIKDKIGGKNKMFNNHQITNLSHWFRKSYVEDILTKN